MASEQILSGYYYGVAYLKMINGYLASGKAMRRSVETIRTAKGKLFVDRMRWGDYQPLLKPTSEWPNGGGSVWSKATQRARQDLAAQPNYSPVSRNDPRIPPDKSQLLDNAIRRCFPTPGAGQEKPGIPIHTDVLQKSADDPTKDHHDVQIVWTYDWKTGKEIQLNFVMFCPYEPPTSSRRSSTTRKSTQLRKRG